MKLIIAGSRTFNNYEFLAETISRLYTSKGIKITEIVSGGARGADKLGERYAKENLMPVKIFPAAWDCYGKSAGFRRNIKMAEYGDMVIVFWDGKSVGTKHMINIAQSKGLKVEIVQIEK